MEPILFFIGFLISFLIGYLFGKDLRVLVSLLESLREIKKNTVRAFAPREKVVILNSKDSYLPEEDEEQEEIN